MSRTPSTATDSDGFQSVVEVSTAPTTPDGSLSFSPILAATQLLDRFGGAFEGTPTPTIRDVPAILDLNGQAPVVRNICCVGAGYVGGPTSAIIAFQNPNITVNVVDRDPARIASWKSKHLPIHESGLSDIVRIARDGTKGVRFNNAPTDRSGSEAGISPFDSESEEQRDADEIALPAREPNLFFSTEVARCISEADIILITVNTPTKRKGMGKGMATDMVALEGATKEIALNAKPGAILVEKSTVPCGTSELIKDIWNIHRPGVPFEVLSNPEFLAEGTAVKDLLSPDRVIIGSADTESGRKAAATLAGVYAAWVPKSRITTINVWSSELSKLVANAMLAQRISSINSVSAICERTGANISEIALSIGLDPRIGPKFLKAGVGFGGSCFKKDILSLVYLAQSLGLPEVGEYWQQVLTMNESQRDRFAQRVILRLNNTLIRKKIAVLGYAFKNNTTDTREAPALDVLRTLLAEGPGEIAIYDPWCDPKLVKSEIQNLLGSKEDRLLREEGGPVEVYTTAYDACLNANAVLILTEWDQFRNTPLASSTGKLANPTHKSRYIYSHPKAKSSNADPRPFSTPEPTESDLLALHKHLASTSNSQSALNSASGLGRYLPEPDCENGCAECSRAGAGAENAKVVEQVDWNRLSVGLKEPKWVFDGRCIMDIPALEKLGIRGEAVGLMPPARN